MWHCSSKTYVYCLRVPSCLCSPMISFSNSFVMLWWKYVPNVRHHARETLCNPCNIHTIARRRTDAERHQYRLDRCFTYKRRPAPIYFMTTKEKNSPVPGRFLNWPIDSSPKNGVLTDQLCRAVYCIHLSIMPMQNAITINLSDNWSVLL